MRNIILLLAVLLVSNAAMAQKSKGYQYSVDLNNSSDDKFWVELLTPAIKTKTTVFHLPKTVPGTYSNDDYGYFANELKAFDGKGNELTVTRLDVNSWQIDDAKKLAKITYKADDTFDDRVAERKGF
jgi:predicted metalloprotease with PDZ domain